MKKYKKPVLDIVEFDNMDVIMESDPPTDDGDNTTYSGKVVEDTSSTGSEDSDASSTGTGDSDTSSTGTEDSSSDDNSVDESGIE